MVGPNMGYGMPLCKLYHFGFPLAATNKDIPRIANNGYENIKKRLY